MTEGKTYGELKDALAAEDAKRQEVAMAVLRDAGRDAILREYARLGVEPVYADKERMILVSPWLLKKEGTR